MESGQASGQLPPKGESSRPSSMLPVCLSLAKGKRTKDPPTGNAQGFIRARSGPEEAGIFCLDCTIFPFSTIPGLFEQLFGSSPPYPGAVSLVYIPPAMSPIKLILVRRHISLSVRLLRAKH
ncbi:hypothetical protein DUI87_10361 [Hirundo rustica rustica]|uniref:Uncharacterized protein n=1 Tax=Hirundo rustica rustica TaxID=333673 RepID=A0A3M0KIF6_HIRRU|nr:hypothetical protein DUI87_10361 [Hirundo rustica rustica]